MAKGTEIVAFEGGQLIKRNSGVKGREVVLALPLSRFIVKVLRFPVDAVASELAEGILSEMTPFPDEPLTVGIEKVCEDERHQVVIAAALPESAAEDVSAKLDEEKLNVVSVDALVFGELRTVWGKIGTSGRKIVIFRSPECLSLVILNGDMPCAIRSAALGSDIRRDITLSLLEAEDFCGSAELEEIVVVKRVGDEVVSEDSLNESLTSFNVPVRTIEVDLSDALDSIAERSEETGSLNALPESWSDVLKETRFKAKLTRFVAIACSIWAVALAVLIGVPFVFDYLTDYQKELCRRHSKAFRAVSDKRAKVKLVRKYSDHSLGALEIMKAVSDRLPEGIILSSWSFNRDEGLDIAGDSADSSSAYQLKDVLAEMASGEEEEGTLVFGSVRLGPLNKHKDGRQKFDLKCLFKEAE